MPGADHQPPRGALADRLAEHVGVLLERDVDDAALGRGHRLEFVGLAALGHLDREALGEFGERVGLTLA